MAVSMLGVKRLLIVTRHYWPCTNDATLRLQRLVERLTHEQWVSTIVTPRWHSSWPSRLSMGKASVIRLDAPPISASRQIRYWQNLRQWLLERSSEFDAVYCDQADGDAETVLNCWPNPGPSSVVRLDPDESGTEYPMSVLKACCKATTLVVPTQLAHRRAIALGLPSELLVRSSDWQVSPVERNASIVSEARRILGDANLDLALHQRDRLIVVPGELTSRWRIDFLIHSLGKWIDEQPGIRLWILGGGSGREETYNLLKDFGIHRIVALPGTFTSLDTVLQAADLCLFPGHGCGRSYLIPTCIMSGIPILAAHSSELEHLIGQAASKMCFALDSAEDLLQRVRCWWNSPDELQEEVRIAQRFLRRQLGALPLDGGLSVRWRLQASSPKPGATEIVHSRLRPAQ